MWVRCNVVMEYFSAARRGWLDNLRIGAFLYLSAMLMMIASAGSSRDGPRCS